MKKNYKKTIKYILFALFIFAMFGIGTCFAETVEVTSGELKFCDYKNTRITLRTLGYIITIIKVVVPIILIGVGMMDFFKVVLSGKTEDISKAVTTIIKRCIAGLIVFLVPSLMNYVFNDLVEYNDPTTKECTKCILDPGKCNVDIEDPDYKIKKTVNKK